MNPEGKYPIHMILGDKTYCKIRKEELFKGNPGDPIVEGSTLVHLAISFLVVIIRVNSACLQEIRASTRD
jgi:hypothetical protein